MNHLKTLREIDVEKLGRLASFSRLTPGEIKLLVASLVTANWGRGEVIFREHTYASEAHVLVAGIARITCLNADKERTTVGLIAPGPIPELPSLSTSRFDFRCEAYSNCRVGTLDWSGFAGVTLNGREAAFTRFHHSSVKYWYRLFRRTSGLLDLDLHERLALTMLDLSEDFGIADARGTMLGIPISHKDIANIVGASRPRITEHLAQMERDQMIIRQGRQFIINTEELSRSLATRSILPDAKRGS
jgi:CRP/FNR family cyclic AMP-dependent transcriptional regulator